MGNPALIPVPGFEKDFYDWPARHAAKVAAARTRRFPILMVGDSITHLFEGDPGFPGRFGAALWPAVFKGQALNLGYGFDRTQNVLWRLDHGELDGQSPDVAVVMIGTNNLGPYGSVPPCPPGQTVEGVAAVCDRLRQSGAARVLAMAILPRGAPDDPIRGLIADANRRITALAGSRPWLEVIDIGPAFLDADGSIPRHLMEDGTHPSTDGYRLWIAALAARGCLPR